VGQQSSWFRRHVVEHRTLLGEFAFELVIVFVGVTAAFALENYRQKREAAAYQHAMVDELRASMDDFATHGADIDRRIGVLLSNFAAARKAGKCPPVPVYRESGGERPPTRVWDGIVATGAARSLDPKLFFRLAVFYHRADSFGDRYLRYNAFSEERVLPYINSPTTFCDPRGRLKPEYSAYVDRLADLQTEMHALVVEAASLSDSLPH
jgi:hypothetical protein